LISKKSRKLNHDKYFLFFIFGIVVGVLSCWGYYVVNSSEFIVEKEQPMLLTQFIEWGESIEDSSTILFIYYIYNFGNIEAKNVKVKCVITDIDENILKQQSFNIGNIASNSYEYQESSIKYYLNPTEHLAYCELESADGEYINLEERLAEIEE